MLLTVGHKIGGAAGLACIPHTTDLYTTYACDERWNRKKSVINILNQETINNKQQFGKNFEL